MNLEWKPEAKVLSLTEIEKYLKLAGVKKTSIVKFYKSQL